MAESILERIAQRLGSMPSGERKAGQALIANYPLAGLATVAEFSKSAGVSAPTVLRFVARLGFASYPEFQAALKGELAERVQSPLVRSETPLPPGIEPFLAAVGDNLRETFRHIPPEQIGEIAVRLADQRGRVFLVGGRFTDPVARYMAAHLKIVRPGVIHLPGQESTWRDQLIDVGRRDTVVLFDIRRYSGSLAGFAAAAAERGATVILFTDQWLSPISRFARHVVSARTAVPSPWDSCTALFAASELILGAATRAAGDNAARRIREVERLRSGTPEEGPELGPS